MEDIDKQAAKRDQIRWEYEHTVCSQRYLAAKYNVKRDEIQFWSSKYNWIKHQPPDGPALSPARRKAYERRMARIEQEIQERALVNGLASSASPDALPTSPAADAPGTPAPAPPATPAKAEKPAQSAAVAPPVTKGKESPGARIISFPGAKPPPKKDPTEIRFPPRSKTEEAELRMQLASARGALSMRQLTQIERHERLLEDYAHLLSVYLTPHEYIDIAHLDEEKAQEKLRNVQRAALARVLPTETDSLAGALKTLTSGIAAMVNLKRVVGGLAGKAAAAKGAPPGGDEEPREATSDLSELDVSSLRSVTAAMRLLAGEKARSNEPPKPPPPESLEDLKRVDEPPAEA
jgi:hypothetical protein